MINAFGPVYGYLGYQVHARNFFRALDRLEPVCLTSSNPNAQRFPVDPQLAQMLARTTQIDLSQPGICIDYANNFHRFHSACRIGYTVFEYTRLGADWVNGLSQVDAIWTTSAWGKSVIAAHGLDDRRIEAVPEGFDPQVFHAGLRAQRKDRGRVFRFLTVGKWEVRKGQVDLLRAYAQAFRHEKDVELVLMCDNPFVPGFSVQSEIAKLGLGKTAPIKVAKPLATDAEMAAVYAAADCFVLPTRAEGWGLPIMEAMACGTPVITTRYSAMTEYANDANAYLLNPERMVPVFDPLFFPQAGVAGEWAQISVDELAARMRHVYEQRDEAAALGLAAAQDMAQHWTWDHAAQKARVLIDRYRQPTTEVMAPPPPDPAAAVRAGDRSPAVLAALTLSDLIAIAEAIGAGGDQAGSIALYRDWIERSGSPYAFVARFNLGRMVNDAGDLVGAEKLYREALAQQPNFPQALLNLGSVLERQGRNDEAISSWQQAMGYIDAAETPDPGLQKHALNNLGRLLEQLHRYPESEAMLVRSLAVDPTQSEVIHHYVHLRQKQCEWPVYTPLPGVSVEKMVASTSALAMLSAANDPALQLETALHYVREKVPTNLPPMAPAQGYAHDRLRIGYLSSNLNLHAVTILTAEVYELHDRSRVEVWAFCWSPEDGTPMRQRIRAAMDHLVRIDQMTDEQAAQAIRAAEIDILIDLQGLTSGCRPVILAHKPAPVAVSWLGFPGTSGLPGVDYILADRYLIPEELASFYSEKPLYLPDCFQSNDRQRAAGPLPLRATYQLPEDAFVFCAFNHNHKFSPEMFATWMRIVQRVPGSVLWLLADNETARINLSRYAAEQGVDPARLVFAPRVHPAEYLARFQLADLFLDTLPFNGGTTASDALWMGLPLLTCSGQTFASRMAGSLLKAIGLPELITNTFADYETLAVALAHDRLRLAELRSRLIANRQTYPLFDTPRLVKALEGAFDRISIAS
jgi:predicted O-linked N-acetylglucosamine transferase (SPINDLY family)/glycosyltransferase involved in cell wall biosynthesis